MIVSIGEAGDGPVALFLEIDLGTVDLSRFAKKCQSFTHVSASGLAIERTGSKSAALAIVTTCQTRLGRLRGVAEDRGARRSSSRHSRTWSSRAWSALWTRQARKGA